MTRYRPHSVQKLEDHNYTARDDIANYNCSLQNIQSDTLFLNCIIYFDECVFHVDRKVNKHNWLKEWKVMSKRKIPEVVKA